MPHLLRGNISHLVPMLLLISGCSGPEEATTPNLEDLRAIEGSASPEYDQLDGDIYMYVAELSDDAKAQGESASVIAIRYLGSEGAVERLEIVDDNGGRISIVECSKPCAVSKVTNENGIITRQAVNPLSILAAAFQDAFNGYLLPALSTNTVEQPLLLQKNATSEIVAEAGAVMTPRENAQSIQVYQGKTFYPDFIGRDKDYASYRTKIITEMKSGPNFAGRYAIVVIGCGTGCKWVTSADVSTGRLYDFPYGGEDYQQLDLSYSVKSNDITAKWIGDEGCMEDYLSWDGARFISQSKRRLGDNSSCDG